MMNESTLYAQALLLGFRPAEDAYSQKVFGCSRSQLKACLVDQTILDKVKREVCETKLTLITGRSRYVCRGSSYGATAIMCRCTEEYHIPLFDSKALFQELKDNYPNNYLEQLIKATTLSMLLDDCKFVNSDLLDLQEALDVLWTEYMQSIIP